MAICDGGWELRSDVLVGVDEPLLMYVGVAVDVEKVEGMVVMIEIGVGVLPFVL
jgi:hypothetical protein